MEPQMTSPISPAINIKVIGGNDYSTDVAGPATGTSELPITVNGAALQELPTATTTTTTPIQTVEPSQVVTTAEGMKGGFVVKKV
jgi:hypothetical protein